MTKNAAATIKISARDLRDGLAIAYQPTIMEDAYLLSQQVRHSIRYYADSDVTERRLLTAAAAVGLDEQTRDQIVAGLRAARA